jgi:hypothetical protein
VTLNEATLLIANAASKAEERNFILFLLLEVCLLSVFGNSRVVQGFRGEVEEVYVHRLEVVV